MNWLKEIRTEKGYLTQESLVSKLKEVGCKKVRGGAITLDTLKNWETDKVAASTIPFGKIARALMPAGAQAEVEQQETAEVLELRLREAYHNICQEASGLDDKLLAQAIELFPDDGAVIRHLKASFDVATKAEIVRAGGLLEVDP